MTRAGRRHHASTTTEWLDLLAVDGPFLAAPVVKDVWLGGLPALNKDDVGALREASNVLDASPGTRDAFIRHVLTSFLGWKSNLIGAGHVPATLTTPVPEYSTEVRPDFALLTDPDDLTSPPLLLGIVVDPGVRATARPRPGTPGADKWPVSFADRLAHGLRARKVPLGIVTNGTDWTLVCAPAGGATTTATWTRHTWFDEPDTLKAFAALLGRLRFFGVPEDQTLPALLAASLDRQQEITTRLSEQSQAVVEMLVATIGRLDADHRAQHGEPLLPASVEPAEVYQGAVTVLMRLVFLLYAEERGLLRVDDDLYADAYAVSTLAEQLREWASDVGEDTLERSTTAWQRMLATFRAIHRGARHDQLTLPGYGGSLFDPDRFPWLEGRPNADAGLEGAEPLRIDDRTVLRALEALQWLRFAGERRRVSFRVLDVEQIGYVYEGLLDQDARRAHDWILGLAGDSKGEKDGPEISLTELIENFDQGAEHFATWLSGEIKAVNGSRTAAAITKALIPPKGDAADAVWVGVLEACGGDESTARSIVPFAGLLRRDPRDLPVIYPPGTMYLTDSELRTSTGSYYTPRSLAEEVVARTLEPLVKSPGPLDSEDESTWKIRTPEQILALKVIDIAAGSGAFLVAATRYLADRLLDAKRVHDPAPPGGEVDDEQAIIDARRQVLDHCIYGVDINPMAVEMAKLSLWLVTLDPNRPFGFLDDRLAVGDSLLGLTIVDQLLDIHLDPRKGRKARRHDQIAAYTADVPALLKQSALLRERIAKVDLIDSHSADHKARLLAESQQLTQRLTVLAGAISGASLSGGTEGNYAAVAAGFGIAISGGGGDTAWKKFQDDTRFALTDERGQLRHPAHFPLLFPEAFTLPRMGFDAVIGNPPFLGNRHWKSHFGSKFQSWAARLLEVTTVGKIDLSLLFLRRAWDLLAPEGQLGVIATTSLREPESRPLGYSALAERGGTIYAARSTMKWPTAAAGVYISIVWIAKAGVQVRRWLDGHAVDQISAALTADTELPPPKSLNWLFAFEGVHNAKGSAFVLDALDERLPPLLAEAPDVWRPYLTGEDIANQIAIRPVRYCLDSEGKLLDEICSVGPRTKNYLIDIVRPERTADELKPYKGLHERWWQMWNSRADLRMQLREISPYCLAMPAVSKYAIVALVPSEWVATNKVRVIEYKGPWLHAMLLSQWFEAWVWKYSGRMGSSIINLAVSGAIRTFPLLSLDNDWAHDWIDAWDRSIIAATRQGEGQTSFWNRYHNRSDETGIAHCRTLRSELDDKISAENSLPIFTSTEVQIDVGPRFGWDGGQRESAISLMHAVNSDQGNGGKRAKRVPRRPSPTVTGSQGSFEGF